jgi:hypothetical protein
VLNGLFLMGHTAIAAFALTRTLALGLGSGATVLAVYSVGNLVSRFGLASVIDRIGTFQGPLLAGTCITTGMIGASLPHQPAGLYIGAALAAVGMALQAGLLPVIAFERGPAGDRAAVFGTYSSFADIAGALGGTVLGVAITVSGTTAGAFIAAGGCAMLAMLLVPWTLETGWRERLRGPAAADISGEPVPEPSRPT